MQGMSQGRAVTALRILYPIWMVVGVFSFVYVPSVVVVAGDATATANNLLSHEFLFRAGIVAGLVSGLIFIVAALLLHRLLGPVNRDASMLMVIVALVSVPIAMLNDLSRVAALLSSGDAEQATFFLELNLQGTTIASIFWGLWLFPLGYLVYVSGYFPKIIGAALIVGGIGYTADSFLSLLWPDAAVIQPVFDVMVFGEVVFVAWLLIRGAKLPAATGPV